MKYVKLYENFNPFYEVIDMLTFYESIFILDGDFTIDELMYGINNEDTVISGMHGVASIEIDNLVVNKMGKIFNNYNFITNEKNIVSDGVCLPIHSISICEDDIPAATVIKTKDEWFYVFEHFGRLYKCDQIDGLLKVLNLIKSGIQN